MANRFCGYEVREGELVLHRLYNGHRKPGIHTLGLIAGFEEKEKGEEMNRFLIFQHPVIQLRTLEIGKSRILAPQLTHPYWPKNEKNFALFCPGKERILQYVSETEEVKPYLEWISEIEEPYETLLI